MLRQLMNLKHFGRIRTIAKTPRTGKPKLLVERPELEITDLLEMVVDQLRVPDDEFFFVQIGAFDGKTGDPLFHMVRRRGWHGVLVEPQPRAYATLMNNYADQSGLQFFNVAIGPTDGELTLYSRKSGDVSVAGASKHLVIKPGHRRGDLIEYNMPCWTFKKLLREASAPSQIHLLQIDAEGFDYEIIRSIDFTAVRPLAIRFEHQILSQGDRNACLKHLASHGYRFLLEDSDTTAILQPSEKRTSRAA